MQVLSLIHSLYSTINARNQIRNKATLESRGSGAVLFLDHALSRVFTILSIDKSSKRDKSIIADSSSESVVTFYRESMRRFHVNPTTYDHEAVTSNVDEEKSAAGTCSMVWVAG